MSKFEADDQGNETEVPFEHMIEIGAFAEPAAGKEFAESLLREKRMVKSGMNTLSFELDSLPHSAGIDPFLLLVDRVPADNVRRVQQE